MKKSNPVPDPIVPTGYKYRIQHFHTGNTPQEDLDWISNIKRCRYVTQAILYDSSDNQITDAWSYCSPLDNPNKRYGTITAVHRAVKKVFPDFYKNIRTNRKYRNFS